MATVQSHGGGCCGVRHLYGMDNTTVRDVERMIAEVDRMQNVGGADSGRLIEVILSQRQVGMDGRHGDRWADCVRAEGGWPAVMQRLGFRLVSRFNNANSGYDCFVFHRVPHFKSIRAADLPFAWDHDTAFGIRAAGGPGAMAAPRVNGRDPRWPVGTRITYSSNGPRYGMVGTIVATGDPYRIRWDNGEEIGGYAHHNLTPVLARAAHPAPVAVPVVPHAPLVVATFYANVLQAGMGAFWPTLEAARAAAPRCRQQARIEVLSDGNRRTVNL